MYKPPRCPRALTHRECSEAQHLHLLAAARGRRGPSARRRRPARGRRRPSAAVRRGRPSAPSPACTSVQHENTLCGETRKKFWTPKFTWRFYTQVRTPKCVVSDVYPRDPEVVAFPSRRISGPSARRGHVALAPGAAAGLGAGPALQDPGSRVRAVRVHGPREEPGRGGPGRPIWACSHLEDSEGSSLVARARAATAVSHTLARSITGAYFLFASSAGVSPVPASRDHAGASSPLPRRTSSKVPNG